MTEDVFAFDTVLVGDCLELMKAIPDGTVDLVLCDLPYGCTARNAWDKPIPMMPLWVQYRRVLKEHGAIVLTGQGMFSAELMLAGRDLYKYSLIWKKNKPRGFLNVNRQPLRIHEDILVFYRKQPVYHPQKTTDHSPVHSYTKHTSDGTNYGRTQVGITGGGGTDRFPTSIIEIPVVNNDRGTRTHPTEKPLELGSNIVRTFTNPGDFVLDNACGTGAFLLAAKVEGRRYLGMDLSPEYAGIALARLSAISL